MTTDKDNQTPKIVLPDWFNDKKREEEILNSIKKNSIKSVPFILPTSKKYILQKDEQVDLPDGVFINPITLKEEKSVQNEGKFYLSDVGYFILKSFNEELCSLGVVGPARKGKSYLLSRILGVKHAFQLGHTMNSQTRGIWIGTTLADGNEGKKIVCFDTEGINAFDTTTDNDNTIFVLTVLLTSTLVYNSASVPQATDLDKMSFITSLVERIAIRATTDDSGDDFPKYFPDLIWVLRDVLLETSTEEVILSPVEYLKKKVLNYKKSFKIEDQMRDATKKAIMTFFPSIDCHTVSPPTTDPKILKDIEDVSPSKLDPKFLQEIEKVISVLRTNCRPKMIGEAENKRVVKGEVLANVAFFYVSAINQPGMVPSVLSASEQAEYISSRKSIQKAFDSYVETMSKLKLPLISKEIMEKHNQQLMNSVDIVKNDAFVANAENIKKYTQELSDMICITDKDMNVVGGFLHNLIKDNYSKALKSNTELIQKMYSELWNKIRTNSYDFDSFRKDIEKMISDFKHKSYEVSREEVITNFLNHTLPADEINIKQIAGYKKQVAEEERKNNLYQAELEKSRKDLEEQQRIQLENAKNNKEMMEKVVKEQQERAQEMMQQMMKEKKESEERFMMLQTTLHEDLAKASKENLEMMQMQLKAMQDNNQRMMEQHEKNMQQMTENMKAIANRPVQVSGGGGCCIL